MIPIEEQELDSEIESIISDISSIELRMMGILRTKLFKEVYSQEYVNAFKEAKKMIGKSYSIMLLKKQRKGLVNLIQ